MPGPLENLIFNVRGMARWAQARPAPSEKRRSPPRSQKALLVVRGVKRDADEQKRNGEHYDANNDVHPIASRSRQYDAGSGDGVERYPSLAI